MTPVVNLVQAVVTDLLDAAATARPVAEEATLLVRKTVEIATTKREIAIETDLEAQMTATGITKEIGTETEMRTVKETETEK